MTEDDSMPRARLIMQARVLLHRVDEETADARWQSEPRRRKLHQIINTLAQAHPPESGPPEDG